LAGLIDGAGHFSVQQQLVISFYGPDRRLAYVIRSRLGVGSVTHVVGKNSSRLILSSRAGIGRVLTLINGRLRTQCRYAQVVNNILSHRLYADLNEELVFTLNSTADFENH